MGGTGGGRDGDEVHENHVVIPTGITGTSWKRQEFLIIGKDRSSILRLVIYPPLVLANCNEELFNSGFAPTIGNSQEYFNGQGYGFTSTHTRASHANTRSASAV